MKTDMDYYDRLRMIAAANSSATDAPQSRVVAVRDPSTEQTYHLVHFSMFLPLSFGRKVLIKKIIASAFASMLAIHHLNNGIGEVVPAIAEHFGTNETKEADRRCRGDRVRFTFDVFDTEVSSIVGMEGLWNRVRPGGASATETTYPTALLGPITSIVSSLVAPVTGALEIPVISQGGTSASLDNKDEYPYLARMTHSSVGYAQSVVDYFVQYLNVRHVGVVYPKDHYGIPFFAAFESAAREAGLTFQAQSLSTDTNIDEVRAALTTLKSTGYRYFVNIMWEKTFLTYVMEEAYHQGMAGPDNFWLITNEIAYGKLEAKSTIANATDGTAILWGIDSHSSLLDKVPSYGSFVSSWRETIGKQQEETNGVSGQNALSYFISKMPDHIRNNEGFKFPDSPENAALFSSLSYDSVVAFGLAACSGDFKNGTFFTGPELYEAFLSMEFDGTSGKVRIDRRTGARTPESLIHGIKNVRVDAVPNVDGKVAVNLQQTALKVDGMWESYGKSFIYANGSTDPPNSLPPIKGGVDLNLIPTWLQAVGLAFCALVLVLSLLACVWTKRNAKNSVVRSSQPIFLIMLSVGTFVLASSIIPLSLQEPVSQGGLDAACMAFPWLSSMGLVIIFSALFSKTNRSIRVVRGAQSFSKVTVTVRDVMLPFTVLFILNCVVLSVWTAVDPLRWVRVPIDYDRYERTIRSNGTCDMSSATNKKLFYSFYLTITFVPILFTSYVAYKARDIKTAFQESYYIALTVHFLLEAFLIGVPILVVTTMSSTDRSTEFIVLSLFVVIISLVVLALIFIPKYNQMKKALRERQLRATLRLERQKRNSDDRARWSDPGFGVQTTGMSSGQLSSYGARIVTNDRLNSADSERNSWAVGSEP